MAQPRDKYPPLLPDPVIEFYKKDIDRTLLIENLKLTVEQRLRRLQEFVNGLEAMQQNARRAGAPVDAPGTVVDVFKQDVDRGMLRNNLRRSVEDRLRELMRFEKFIEEMRRGTRKPA